jgi:hypothetical protein
MANTRLKDFCDIWLIVRTFQFQKPILVEVVSRTFERRETALPAEMPSGLSEEFVAARADHWRPLWGASK